MDFSTLCCERQGKDSIRLPQKWAAWALAWLIFILFSFYALSQKTFAQAPQTLEISSLRVEQSAEGMHLSAQLRFELPQAVEDALRKGVTISFIAQAQVYRDRWYWYDKALSTHTRQMRLSFQPLTRRWRLSLGEAGGTGLTQSFDSLLEALVAIRRISRWKIAESSEIDADAKHNIDFKFRLDTSQLPRPLQVGLIGNSEWSLAANRSLRPEIVR